MSSPLHTRASTRGTLTRLGENLASLARMATTPLLPHDYLELVDPLRLSTRLRGRIVERRAETPDAATLVIRPGRGWHAHLPGQYVRLGVDIDGVRHWRAYSLTSPVAAPDGCIAVTVTRAGLVSSHLVDRITTGALIHLDQATGDFVMPAAVPDKILFLTAGSGLTPIIGMLRNDGTALADVTLVHCAPDARRTLFRDELRALATVGEISYHEWFTGERGRLDLNTPDALDRLVPDWRDRHTWACGPGPMLDACEELWTGQHLLDRLHTERFRTPIVAVGEGGTVHFDRTGRSATTDGATTLLDLADSQDVLAPSGCRMGICFGCIAPLLAGSVRDLRDGRITTALPDDGPVDIQTCIHAPAGDCTLDL
ncbi:Ferredoxin-NADP reductase [Austwickia chelonae]|uniref:Putative oxidoreductase n=1 Tax=Austwickia chelonae NBRC 105200 TaxID=1184607 RepID=K6VAQ5_9MICO|nr:ferredoxin reductase [Austwickia chelonae]GAB79328.1 putative oxidoreductase [Austwickia chelonae NBRC 105200]SEW38347.1 Ferredoxin-NADP reductase [Austwickia chelonae]